MTAPTVLLEGGGTLYLWRTPEEMRATVERLRRRHIAREAAPITDAIRHRLDHVLALRQVRAYAPTTSADLSARRGWTSWRCGVLIRDLRTLGLVEPVAGPSWRPSAWACTDLGRAVLALL